MASSSKKKSCGGRDCSAQQNGERGVSAQLQQNGGESPKRSCGGKLSLQPNKMANRSKTIMWREIRLSPTNGEREVKTIFSRSRPATSISNRPSCVIVKPMCFRGSFCLHHVYTIRKNDWETVMCNRGAVCG
ncbi:hypothetical protein AVEN_170052-1 [Araneus ventricosus]|uniref:Uncharacterized protein n=1 Tax=Araneus ventricosus TaxID=182803 RepID=A0A4Y2X697_ARAVE|nr:hypothetical protein AVEN_170052-1 [Araneus ventricosus]